MAEHDLLASPRYSWPLLVAAAQVAADVACLPVAARADADAELADAVLGGLRGLSAKLAATGPVEIALQLTFRAELARTEIARTEIARTEIDGTGRATGECQLCWQAAVDAWDELGEPLRLSTALYRVAEAALTERADREQAAPPLRRAAGIATELGAGRLLADVRLLARRGRIDLASRHRAAASCGSRYRDWLARRGRVRGRGGAAPAWLDPTGVRGPSPGSNWPQQCGGCGRAIHLCQDRQRARVQHHGEAGRRQQRRGCGDRAQTALA